MKSMTAYSQVSFSLGQKRFRLEVQSLNKKGLDIQLDLPGSFNSLQIPLRLFISETIERGTISLRMKEEVLASGNTASIDLSDVKAKMEEVAISTGFPKDVVTFNLLLEKSYLFTQQEEHGFDDLKPHVEKALKSLIVMRESEGGRLKKDFLHRLHFVETSIQDIEELQKHTPETIKQKLLERIKNLGLDNPEDERFFKEVVYFVDKQDVSEEITRLRSHIYQFRHLLDKNEPIGRKLEFLTQECFRELNTLSAKTSELKSVNLALVLKNEFEKIKEQVMNIE